MRIDPLRNVPDDAQFDAEVQRWARDHNVSYMSALKSVTAVYAAQQDAADANMDPSEAALYVQSTRYAQEHGVSYAEAASRTAQALAPPSDIVETPGAGRSDWALHENAKSYAAANRVSYAEALRQVCEFSSGEAGTTAHAVDNVWDAEVKKLAAERGISYLAAANYLITIRTCSNKGDGELNGFRESAWGCADFAEVDSGAVAALEGQMIEIFKAGRHVSGQGESIYFSPQDIANIATGYRPALREAPLVEGHPAHDEPAMGWVSGLEATPDGRLMMKVRQLDPAFAERVKAGRFKKRSASFYPPQHPSNPNPSQWYLRHVGWLGALQPAVSGLQDVNV